MKYTIKTLIVAAATISTFVACDQKASNNIEDATYCNPLDLSYRFMVDDEPSRREAADPTLILYKDTYYLFASKTGGYWWSDDMTNWNLVLTDEIPTEEYAPTAIVMRDTMFLMASATYPNKVIKTADPKSGHWSVARPAMERAIWDPCFFMDDDNKLYLYWGCSPVEPLYGVELDQYDFSFKGDVKPLFGADPKRYGWEVRGDDNTQYDIPPYVEGAWMNKRNGIYYLQYAAPGTCEKSYSDAVYTSTSPLGEYTLAPHNAFAYKPEGYACGAGHGSTFADRYGNYWHAGTVIISVKHKFERRLSLDPVFFDKNDNMYSHTRFGDYPYKAPQRKVETPEEFESGWMLLSYQKPVEVSSTAKGYSPEAMTDEEIRTYWAAQSGEATEWAMVDLTKSSDIYALQVNFAENNTNIRGRQKGITHKYIVEASSDKCEWVTLKDESQSTTDNTHNYIELDKHINARYVRVRNIEVPDGEFAISGLRVFGYSDVAKPSKVNNLVVCRNADDRRSVTLKWDNVEGAYGYNVRYGVAEDMMYHNFMVYSANDLTINSLSVDQPYFYAVEALNEAGCGELSDVCSTK